MLSVRAHGVAFNSSGWALVVCLTCKTLGASFTLKTVTFSSNSYFFFLVSLALEGVEHCRTLGCTGEGRRGQVVKVAKAEEADIFLLKNRASAITSYYAGMFLTQHDPLEQEV